MFLKRVERRSAASAVRTARDSELATADFRRAEFQRAEFQRLEPRVLFDLSMAFDGLFNASKYPGNQSETAVAINKTNANNIFVSSNYGAFREADQGPNDPIAETGIFTAFTLDGGVTWTPRIIGTDNAEPIGVSDDGFPIACCDPSAAFDHFGNLYFSYLAMEPLTQRTSVIVLLSTDGGQTFGLHEQIFGEQPSEPVSVDRNEVTTGVLPDGSAAVWVSYVDFSSTAYTISATGARATGLGTVEDFGPRQKLPQGGPGTGAEKPHNIAHPNVGPEGQVAVAHQEVGRNPEDRIYVNTDLDGLAPGNFGNAVFVDQSHLTFFEPLPSQPVRGVSAVPTLAYDRSNGPHRGRLYMAYAQSVTEQRFDDLGMPMSGTTDSNILLRFSDDDGASWSPAFRVNDDPVTDSNSQFFQRVAVDSVTGNVAVGWLDTRDDASGDADDEAGYYVTVGQSVGNGIEFEPNMRLNVGQSNAALSGNVGNDYGDYTALDFHNNILWASWPDNSNSTGDNPAGRFRSFDVYAGRVRVTDTTVAEPPFATPSSPLAPSVRLPRNLVRGGRFYQLRMTYSHPSGIPVGAVGNDDILVTGPNGFSQQMQLVKAASQQRGTRVAATYRLAAPGGTWDTAENGVYTVTLQGGAVTATDGTASETGTLTRFVVNVAPRRQRGARAANVLPAAAAPALPAPAASVFSDGSLLDGAGGDDESLRLLA